MKYLTKKTKIAALEAVILSLEMEIALDRACEYNGSCFMFSDAFKALGFSCEIDLSNHIYISDHNRAMDWFFSLRPTKDSKYYFPWLDKYPHSAWWFRTSKKGNEQRIKYFKHIIKTLK